jgi:hypothetical protein
MRCFPQVAQYPVRRRRLARTVVNESADGRRLKVADAAACGTEWRLRFSELTDGEAALLQTFFEESEGRLGAFTFLDPVDNLLRWSEGLDQAVWEKGPLVGIHSNDGRIWQVSNTGAASQAITQLVEAPAEYCYCLSVWVRGSGTVTLVRGDERAARQVGGSWRRVTFSAEGQSQGDGVHFGLELGPGGALELFGMQVEAQLGASAYKRTLSRGGVYEGVRFDQDELVMTSPGPGRHECEIKVLHGECI